MQDLVEALFKRCALAAPDRILVATNLTDIDYLTPHAIAQAIASPAHVTLVNAVVPSDLLPVESADDPCINTFKINRDVRLKLLGVAREIEAYGVPCNVAVKNGYAADVIREEIVRMRATRLIMGTYGHRRLNQPVLGSVAHELITSTDIPVFIVGPQARDAVRHVMPRHILHPVSLVGDYQESVHLALDVAQAYRAELTLLHVFDPDIADSIDPERILDWAKNTLDALIPDATDLVPLVHTVVTTGKLADEVLKVANRTSADWIVLGADGGYRFRPFITCTACQVLAVAKCPVLKLHHRPNRTESKNSEEAHFTSPL